MRWGLSPPFFPKRDCSTRSLLNSALAAIALEQLESADLAQAPAAEQQRPSI